jgi:hypothetical protein
MRDDDKTKAYAARRTAEGKTRREIVRCIKRYINGFYNPRRRHSALGGRSHLAFERQAA